MMMKQQMGDFNLQVLKQLLDQSFLLEPEMKCHIIMHLFYGSFRSASIKLCIGEEGYILMILLLLLTFNHFL